MDTIFYLAVMTAIVVAFLAKSLLKKRTPLARGHASPRPTSMRHLADLVPGGPLTTARIQRNTRAAVLGMGFHSIYERNLIFPMLVVASVSPEAFQMIEPYQRQLADELEAHLPREAAEEGWTVSGQLSITFESDASLTGDTVRVRPSSGSAPPPSPVARPSMASRVTQTIPADQLTPRIGGQPGLNGVAQLWDLSDPHSMPITLQPDREYTIGASGVTDIQIDRPDVSGMHASVKWGIDPLTGQVVVMVRDIDSTNGTAVDGRRVGRQGTKTGAGCLIRLGQSSRLRVTVGQNWSRVTNALRAEA